MYEYDTYQATHRMIDESLSLALVQLTSTIAEYTGPAGMVYNHTVREDSRARWDLITVLPSSSVTSIVARVCTRRLDLVDQPGASHSWCACI